MKLRPTHISQMLAYTAWARETGHYYGNRGQFEKRHDEILQWLWTLNMKAVKPKPRLPR